MNDGGTRDVKDLYSYLLKYDAKVVGIDRYKNRVIVRLQGYSKTLWREPYQLKVLLETSK